MELTEDFVNAFNHAMLYEVGAFWDPTDPDVIAGNYQTRDQRRKVGYVNIPSDRGGETKFGIAQNANPSVRVCDLTLQAAMEVYFQSYWLQGRSDQLPHPLPIIHFDGCVNHGIGRANRFLQVAVGVEPDGVVGNITLGKIAQSNLADVITSIAQQRRNFYQSIVNRDPSQGIFLKGWMRRIDEVATYTLGFLQ